LTAEAKRFWRKVAKRCAQHPSDALHHGAVPFYRKNILWFSSGIEKPYLEWKIQKKNISTHFLAGKLAINRTGIPSFRYPVAFTAFRCRHRRLQFLKVYIFHKISANCGENGYRCTISAGGASRNRTGFHRGTAP
jgi:hypothetical protein